MIISNHSKIKSNDYYMKCCCAMKDEHLTLWPTKRDRKAETFQSKAVSLPVGYSVADFIDADDAFIRDAVLEAQSIAEEANANDPIVYTEALAERLNHLRTRLWNQSALFGVLVSELFTMGVCFRHGKKYETARLADMADDYLDLRDRLRSIVSECLEWNESEDLRAKYLDLEKKGVFGFTPLTFGNVTLDHYHYFVEESRESFDVPEGSSEFSEMIYYQDKAVPTEVLKTECLEDVVNFLIYKYLTLNLRMKKCKYCGRFFGSIDSYHSEYCIRRIKGSSGSCRSLGSIKLYEQKIFESPAVREFKRSYKAHNSRVRYGSMTKEAFKAWSAKARAMRDKCLAGEITLDELIAWLDSDKLR